MKIYYSLFMFTLVLIAPRLVHAQYEIRESGTYLNEYRINGEKPSEFGDFTSFILQAPPGKDGSKLPADANGDVPVSGVIIVSNGQRFSFSSARLIKGPSGAFEEVTFTTKTLKGAHFTFKGRFLPRAKQEKPGGNYTELRGVLTKYQNGRSVARTELPFYEYSFM